MENKQANEHVNKQACIYCASSQFVDKKYHDAATEITQILVNSNYTIIYGGGSHGIMGTVADTALEMNGNVIDIYDRTGYQQRRPIHQHGCLRQQILRR